VVTGPLLTPGYLLLRDAVSTPRSYLSDAALGLSAAAPRALPQDFAVALASHVVDGGIVVKALLVAGLWLAGWGSARLAGLVLPAAGAPGQLVAATLGVWNPYVAERLLQGHWSLLVGYGCLPWVAATVMRMREGGGWAHVFALAFWTALAGLTPTGLMLAATVALVSSLAPGDGCSRVLCAAVGLGSALLAALPWLTAAVAAQSLSSSQAEGVRAFAARAEPGLGTLGSLAGLGGIWNGDAVPSSRTTVFAVIATIVLLGLVVAGLPVVLRVPAAVPLLVLAATAVAVPTLMATTPGLAAVEAIVRALPGLGVVRDAQKWVALAVPGYTLAAAGAVVTLRRWMPAAVAAAVCGLALIAVLPDLACGVGGKVVAVRYPPGWSAAAAAINADPRPVAVLPPGSMRSFSWAGDAPVLDPLPRWVRADVLTTGDLTISGRVVPGEGGRAREVERLLAAGADRATLARAGVGWLVTESDGDLTATRIGGEAPPAAHRTLMLVTHVVWLALMAIGGLGALALLRRRRLG
jgi:hypothetical protein